MDIKWQSPTTLTTNCKFLCHCIRIYLKFYSVIVKRANGKFSMMFPNLIAVLSSLSTNRLLTEREGRSGEY